MPGIKYGKLGADYLNAGELGDNMLVLWVGVY